MISRVTFLLGLLIGLTAQPVLAATSGPSASTAVARASLPKGQNKDFGTPPEVTLKPLSDEVLAALSIKLIDPELPTWGTEQTNALKVIANSGDPRLAWVVTDAMRFIGSPRIIDEMTQTLNQLLGTKLRGIDAWGDSIDRLIAWDIPAPPNYLAYKRAIYTSVLEEWQPLFSEGPIDWRYVSWGGVRIDDRPFDQTDELCNCIPAADNPEVTDADNADWLPDNAVVFGISINGEQRAYPRQIMEVREMVNDTLGGRDLGIPYCTLCASAQAWYTDELPEGIERPVLRTSGLLIRSNKVMYDLVSQSVFDTFLGTAVTGPLAKRNIQLKQANVVTTTWGEWKKTYPKTTVLKEHLALGRDFDFRNGRDAEGPIFPIGNLDPRLAVQEDVLGVVTESGAPIAFHVPSLIKALDAGETVEHENIRVELHAGGVRAVNRETGKDIGSHQAFWFAWSQFYPGTQLWPS